MPPTPATLPVHEQENNRSITPSHRTSFGHNIKNAFLTLLNFFAASWRDWVSLLLLGASAIAVNTPPFHTLKVYHELTHQPDLDNAPHLHPLLPITHTNGHNLRPPTRLPLPRAHLLLAPRRPPLRPNTARRLRHRTIVAPLLQRLRCRGTGTGVRSDHRDLVSSDSEEDDRWTAAALLHGL